MSKGQSTSIDGVTIEKDREHALCKIESFSDDLKEKIRKELVSIAHGAQQAGDLPDYYSYRNTLQEFVKRYETKTEDTQKGMVGELLSHVIIPVLLKNLTCLSVLFNKEERSIKKGFDIIYCDMPKKAVWYSEVKSGHKEKNTSQDQANAILLKRAYSDLKDKLSGDRASLWQTALIDVALVLEKNLAKNVKKLLADDSPIQGNATTSDKNAILISVLYESPKNPLSLIGLKLFFEEIQKQATFKKVIVFSIQKETFQKVAKFLETEMKHG